MFFEETFGQTGGMIVKFGLALIIVITLIMLVALLLRRFGHGTGFHGKNHEERVKIVDMAIVDSKRRLLLIRRDDVEHLVLIGGTTDLVVEPTIVKRKPGGVRYLMPTAARAKPSAPAPAPKIMEPPAPAPAPIVEKPQPPLAAPSFTPSPSFAKPYAEPAFNKDTTPKPDMLKGSAAVSAAVKKLSQHDEDIEKANALEGYEPNRKEQNTQYSHQDDANKTVTLRFGRKFEESQKTEPILAENPFHAEKPLQSELQTGLLKPSKGPAANATTIMPPSEQKFSRHIDDDYHNFLKQDDSLPIDYDTTPDLPAKALIEETAPAQPELEQSYPQTEATLPQIMDDNEIDQLLGEIKGSNTSDKS